MDWPSASFCTRLSAMAGPSVSRLRARCPPSSPHGRGLWELLFPRGSSDQLVLPLKSHLGFKFPFVKPKFVKLFVTLKGGRIVVCPRKHSDRGSCCGCELGPGARAWPGHLDATQDACRPAVETSRQPPPLTGNGPLRLQPHGLDTRGLTGQLPACSSGQVRVAPGHSGSQGGGHSQPLLDCRGGG